VIGGRTDTFASTVNEAYDPATNTWSTKASMPTGRLIPASAVVNDIIYVIGGQTDSTTWTNVNQAYDPATNTWSSKASMPTPRGGSAVGVINNIIYVAGGRNDTYALTVNEAYDPATNTWSSKASMPTPAVMSAVHNTVAKGRFYVISGLTTGTVIITTNQAYDPVTNTWSTKTSIPTGRWGTTAGVVNDIIYVIGGYSTHHLRFKRGCKVLSRMGWDNTNRPIH